jgi:phospholipid/cholesterol/gamma-HCH transport system substrate-binding protein
MTKPRRASDLVVGITVVVVTVVLITAVLWINQADLRGATLHLTARSRDVGGVSVGNPVVIRGVRAGQVEAIALGDSGWVRLRLGIDRRMGLPADPVVLLTAASLFGEWQATITGFAGVPPDRELRTALLEARTDGNTLPAAVQPDIAQLTSVAGRIAGDVANVAERVRVAFDDQAARELRSSIRNVADLSGELSSTVRRQSRTLDQLGGDVRAGVARVNAAAARVDALTARVDSATSHGELQQILVDARAAAREMADATARLGRMAAELEGSSGAVRSMVARSDSVLGKVNAGAGTLGLLVNDPRLYRQGDSLVADLRALVADVKANPKRYFSVRIF